MNNESEPLNQPEGTERFTATGRPLSAVNKQGQNSALHTLAGVETVWGASAPNHLPVKFTDNSLIPVATLRPEDIGKPVEPKAEKSHWWTSRRRSENTNFVMRQITRGEYLKHYAKDENGRYIGSEEPAADCILKGDDVAKYRK